MNKFKRNTTPLIYHANLDKGKIKSMRDLMQPDVVELAGGDMQVESVEERVKAEEKLSFEKKKRPYSFYRDLIFALIGVRLGEKKAKTDWRSIVNNKNIMSKKLGRNVGVRVAALDYYTNIKHNVKRAVMIDAETLADTVELSITDGLTGAYNRRYFDDSMKRFFQRARRYNEIFSLLLLDVDDFKIYNDNNGHITGDLALIETVRILHAVTQPEDIVARYGGEEFAVIFPNFILSEALNIGESVRQSFKDFHFHNEKCLPNGLLTVSGGITAYDKKCRNIESLIKEADTALYQAKQEGKNRIICYKEIS